MNLRDYQEKAVEDLVEKANDLLGIGIGKTVVFKAPTGSGKTVMMAEFLKRLARNRNSDKSFSFVWTAPRKLHTQSKEKLEAYYYESKALRCASFEELADIRIGENEILFLNWESINREENIYIRESETDYNLSNIVRNTHEDGRNIVLVVDESHFAAATDISRGLIQMIQPALTVEVSATPQLSGDETVIVQRERVIADGMIKKSISLNPGFRNLIEQSRITSSAMESTNELIVKIALSKREELAAQFIGVKGTDDRLVNPLMLIQLPDRRGGTEDLLVEVEAILRDKHKITTENGKLAIYLSENKSNLESITKNDSDVEVMIFKQAIALGWDCPRACILVLFRDWKSIVFSVQTIGRILRMPELKHYEYDELNTGFVFTNLADISVQSDIAGSYLTLYTSQRISAYTNISLPSIYAKRFREETRLSPSFISDFNSAANKLSLATNLDVNIDAIKANLITDGIISNPDVSFDHISGSSVSMGQHSAEVFKISQTEKEIQSRFDLFIAENLHPFAPEQRSVGRVKDSIYRFLGDNYPLRFEYGGVNEQMVVLSPKNSQLFIDTINCAKETYLAKVIKGKKEIVRTEKWEIPTQIHFNNNFSHRKVKLSVMDPFYELNDASTPEKQFVNFLESKSKEIEWWFKNGAGVGTYFAVPYRENGIDEVFYVDWIVKYRNGTLGLFDTKAGITAKTAAGKAAGLAKYIKDQKQKGRHLFGGIVVQRDNSWRYNDSESYEFIENDLSRWKFL